MMAIILAGGKGTRLKPFTITIPKPLLPLGDIPILEIILRQLKNCGIGRVVIAVGHLAHLFEACIGDGSRFGLQIDYCVEDTPLGTAAPLKYIKDLEKDFLVMNGDVLTTLNYKKLFEKQINMSAWGTIALHQREVKIDYGVVKTTKSNLLNEYIEKPTIPYDVSMGINILSRECLNYIPNSSKFDMPELIMAMHQAGKKVICYKTTCYWQDIGRFDDYQRASEDFSKNPARFISDNEG